jgi:enolase
MHPANKIRGYDPHIFDGMKAEKLPDTLYSSRVCKYNKLLRIEEKFGSTAAFAGWHG